MAKNKVFSAQELAVISEAVSQTDQSTDKKLKNLNWLIAGVVIVVFIGFITMVVMVATLLIDSFHINSTIYREYSQKIESQLQNK